MEKFRVGEKDRFDELFGYEEENILEHLNKLIISIEVLINSHDLSIHSNIVDKTMMKIISYLHFFSTTVKGHLKKYNFPCYNEYTAQHKKFLLRFVVLCNNLINSSEGSVELFIEFSKDLHKHLLKFRIIYLQFVAEYKNSNKS
jgi:hypothetical protein